jgi:hypothetical protein
LINISSEKEEEEEEKLIIRRGSLISQISKHNYILKSNKEVKMM